MDWRLARQSGNRLPDHQITQLPDCQMCLSRTFLRSSFCASPTTDSTTWPPLKIKMVGMPRIWNLNEMFGFSSTLSLPTVTLPAYSVASASTVGPRRLHGPHHSAQKSTSTGGADFSTLSSKFPSVKVCTFSAAIVSPAP